MLGVATNNLQVQSEEGGQGWTSAGVGIGASASWRSCQCDLNKCHQASSRCLWPVICPRPKSVLSYRFSEAQCERCVQAWPPGGAVGDQVGELPSLRSACAPRPGQPAPAGERAEAAATGHLGREPSEGHVATLPFALLGLRFPFSRPRKTRLLWETLHVSPKGCDPDQRSHELSPNKGGLEVPGAAGWVCGPQS